LQGRNYLAWDVQKIRQNLAGPESNALFQHGEFDEMD
jgi:hypothetical protein